MRKYFIGIQLLLGLSGLFAQNTTDYSNYYSLSNDKKQLIFIENFTNMTNDWLLGIRENVWRESIEKGYLYFESLENKAKEDYIKVPLHSDIDFEIETSIMYVKGDNTKAYGIQWGKSLETNFQYDFLCSGNCQFTIDKFTGEFHDYVPFTKTKLLQKAKFNRLTIRKIADTYYFFINHSLVHEMPYEPLFGEYIGLQVGELSEIIVDYIKISKIVDQAISQKKKIVITDNDLYSKNGKAEIGKPIHLTLQLKNESDFACTGIDILYNFTEDCRIITDNLKNISLEAQENKEFELVFELNKNTTSNKCNITFSIPKADKTNADTVEIKLDIDKPLPSKANSFVYRTDNYEEYLKIKEQPSTIQTGKYYALIIGIDEYSGIWTKLNNAVSDSKSVERILKTKYHFDEIITLYNQEATRENVINKFEWLMKNVQHNDNLFIFYAGHGDYNNNLNKGFWIPYDANIESLSKYISNDDIKTFLAGIKSQHTLLVADACFSGDIFRNKTLSIPYDGSSKYYNKVYNIPSRKAISSGGIEPVMDGGKNGHSVFAYYFLKALITNNSKYMDASQIYNAIKIPIINNSEQTPNFGSIKNTGDEGGQFIFIHK